MAGDFLSATGGASALRSLARHLVDAFEIHQIAVGYFGDPHGEPWLLYPAGSGGDPFGIQRLGPLLQALRPRLLFLVNDPWVLADAMDQVRGHLSDTRVVLYCPVGGGPLPGSVVERLAGSDRLVTYTEFGRRELERAAAEVRLLRPDFQLPPLDTIPLGVATDQFFPIPAEDRPFVVLNGNRPLPHERLDLTLKAFALFAADKPPSVKLCLPLALPEPGWNLPLLAKRLGVADRIVFGPMALNEAYNAAVVGLNTSTGESWGLSVFEHAATGAAQVLPRHSALEELWQEAARFVEPRLSLTRPGSLVEDRFVSPEDVAVALDELYRDRQKLEHLSAAAYRNAARPEYRWPAIADRWRALFRTLLDERTGNA